jgi:hypothetical protein
MREPSRAVALPETSRCLACFSQGRSHSTISATVMPFTIDRPTRTAKWLAGSTFLRAAQTSKACHAIAGIWICRTTSSLLVNWRMLALMLSHPRKLNALPSVPVTHSHSVKPRSLQTRSTSSREYCRRKMSLPVPSPTKSMELRVADDACSDCRRLSAGNVGCYKGALLLSSGITHPLRATVEEFAAFKAANPAEEATDRATVARPTTDQRARQVRRKPLAVARRMPACLRRAGKGGKQIDAVADLGEQNVR